VIRSIADGRLGPRPEACSKDKADEALWLFTVVLPESLPSTEGMLRRGRVLIVPTSTRNEASSSSRASVTEREPIVAEELLKSLAVDDTGVSPFLLDFSITFTFLPTVRFLSPSLKAITLTGASVGTITEEAVALAIGVMDGLVDDPDFEVVID